MAEKIQMKLGHSPDADDAFMFYAIAKDIVKSDKIEFIQVVEDIQSLNKRALNKELEVTAISAHGYLKVQDDYRIMSCGASMGEGYGPIVVSKEPIQSLEGKRIGVQGAGHVGQYLIKHLKDEGADIYVTDIHEPSLKDVSEKYGAKIIGLDEIYDLDMDIYAPCALGATVNDETLGRLKCSIIAGAANNQLKDEHEILNHWSRNNLLRTFNPEDSIWQEKLINRGNTVFKIAQSYLES